jgi:hypothetical protein
MKTNTELNSSISKIPNCNNLPVKYILDQFTMPDSKSTEFIKVFLLLPVKDWAE